jgi:branched-chain amino acid transport system substrate-binding protein
MMMKIARAGSFGVVAVLAAVLAAGCGSSSKTSTGTATAAAKPAAAGLASATAATKWIADYTGGTAGKADASKPPVKIGYINQQGGPASFDGATFGYEAITRFVNANVGGIQGRPLQLDSCYVLAEEDGQKCAAKFEGDKVSLIVTGQLVVGSAALYGALKGSIPVINMNPGTAPDLTAKNAYGMTSGVLSLGGVGGFVVGQLKPKSVAVVYQNNPTGDLIAQKLLKPQLIKGGLNPTLVPFADTATTPDLVSALSSSKAAKADVLISIISATPCVSFANAYKQLSLTAKVVTEADCYGKQNTKGVGGAWPDGWYFAGNQAYDPHIPDEASGVNAYTSIMNANAKASEWIYDTHATQSFASLMLAVKMLNQAGPDATADQITPLLKAYKGPTALNNGDFNCGLVKTAANICTFNVNFVQSDKGGWLPAAIGAKAINVLTGK